MDQNRKSLTDTWKSNPETVTIKGEVIKLRCYVCGQPMTKDELFYGRVNVCAYCISKD